MVALTTALCFSKGARGCFCTSYLQLPSPKATLGAFFSRFFHKFAEHRAQSAPWAIVFEKGKKKSEVLRSQALSMSMGLQALIGKERECFGFGVVFYWKRLVVLVCYLFKHKGTWQ